MATFEECHDLKKCDKRFFSIKLGKCSINLQKFFIKLNLETMEKSPEIGAPEGILLEAGR